MDSQTDFSQVIQLLNSGRCEEALPEIGAIQLNQEQLSRNPHVTQIKSALLDCVQENGRSRQIRVKTLQALVQSHIVSVFNVEEAKRGSREARMLFQDIDRELSAIVNRILSSASMNEQEALRNINDENTILSFLVGCLESLSSSTQAMLISQLMWAYDDLFGVLCPILNYTRVFEKLKSGNSLCSASVAKGLTELYEFALQITNGLISGLENTSLDAIEDAQQLQTEAQALAQAILLCLGVCRIETMDLNLINNSWKGTMKILTKNKKVLLDNFDPSTVTLAALGNMQLHIQNCLRLLVQNTSKKSQFTPKSSVPEYMKSFKVTKFFMTVLVSLTKNYGERTFSTSQSPMDQFLYCLGLCHPVTSASTFHPADIENLQSLDLMFTQIYACLSCTNQSDNATGANFINNSLISRRANESLSSDSVSPFYLGEECIEYTSTHSAGRLRMLMKVLEDVRSLPTTSQRMIYSVLDDIWAVVQSCFPIMLLDFKDSHDTLWRCVCKGFYSLLQNCDQDTFEHIHTFLLQGLFNPHPIHVSLMSAIWSQAIQYSTEQTHAIFAKSATAMVMAVDESSLLNGPVKNRLAFFFGLQTLNQQFSHLHPSAKNLIVQSLFSHGSEVIKSLSFMAFSYKSLDQGYQAELASRHLPSLVKRINELKREPLNPQSMNSMYWCLIGLHGILSDNGIMESSPYFTLEEKQKLLSSLLTITREGQLPSAHLGLVFDLAILLKRIFSVRHFLEILQAAHVLIENNPDVRLPALSLFAFVSNLKAAQLGDLMDQIQNLLQQLMRTSLSHTDWFIQTESLKVFAQFSKSTTTMTQRLNSFIPPEQKDNVVRFLCSDVLNEPRKSTLQKLTSEVGAIERSPLRVEKGEFEMMDGDDAIFYFMDDTSDVSSKYLEAASNIENTLSQLPNPSAEMKQTASKLISLLRERAKTLW